MGSQECKSCLLVQLSPTQRSVLSQVKTKKLAKHLLAQLQACAAVCAARSSSMTGLTGPRRCQATNSCPSSTRKTGQKSLLATADDLCKIQSLSSDAESKGNIHEIAMLHPAKCQPEASFNKQKVRISSTLKIVKIEAVPQTPKASRPLVHALSTAPCI